MPAWRVCLKSDESALHMTKALPAILIACTVLPVILSPVPA